MFCFHSHPSSFNMCYYFFHIKMYLLLYRTTIDDYLSFLSLSSSHLLPPSLDLSPPNPSYPPPSLLPIPFRLRLFLPPPFSLSSSLPIYFSPFIFLQLRICRNPSHCFYIIPLLHLDVISPVFFPHLFSTINSFVRRHGG